jgi:hypothetical protein
MKAVLFKSTFLIALLIYGISTFAQSYEFRVIGSKGNVLVDGKPLRVGARLNTGQMIEIGEGSYLGLAHKSSKTLELTTPGKYKVTDLQKKLGSSSSGLAARYANFVADELTSDDSRQNRFNQRVKTGSVSRGLDKIKFMLPASATYTVPGSKVHLMWYYDEKEVPEGLVYDVVVTEISPDNHKVLFKTQTKDTFVKLDLSNPAFDKIRNMNIKVSTKYKGEEAVREYGLRNLRGKKLESYNEEVKDFTDTTSPLGKIILARYYEEKKLFANAINQYEEALQMADIDTYRALYNDFLKGNMLTRESRKDTDPNEK